MEVIHLSGDQHDWVIPSKVQDIKFFLPRGCMPTGRPKRQRISSTGEDVIRQMCSRYKDVGHNRVTCRILIQIEPPQ